MINCIPRFLDLLFHLNDVHSVISPDDLFHTICPRNMRVKRFAERWKQATLNRLINYALLEIHNAPFYTRKSTSMCHASKNIANYEQQLLRITCRRFINEIKIQRDDVSGETRVNGDVWPLNSNLNIRDAHE